MIRAESVKERVTVPMLLERYGVKLNRSGRCRCPVHNGHDLNMAVRDRSFRCFVCGASGTVVDLQMALSGHGFNEALKDLNAMFDLGLDGVSARVDELRMASLMVDRAEAAKAREQTEQWNRKQYDLIARARRLRWERGGDCDEIDEALDGLDFSGPIPSAAVLAVNHGFVKELVEVTHGTYYSDQRADERGTADG